MATASQSPLPLASELSGVTMTYLKRIFSMLIMMREEGWGANTCHRQRKDILVPRAALGSKLKVKTLHGEMQRATSDTHAGNGNLIS